MTRKDYRDYIQDILTSIEDIGNFVGAMSYESFIRDKKTTNAVLRSIEIMGEAAKNVPDSIREKYPAVPWKKMAGMRDKLIHEYSGVDLSIIWELIKRELALLTPSVAQVMNELNKG